MKIVTSYELKPIPMRCCDWCAVNDETYDYDQPVGYGATEQEAIEDLLSQIEERE